MKLPDFPVAVHTDSQMIDDAVLRWAETWLSNSDSEADWVILERCSVQKLNWFACYLFPMMEINKLDGIAKLFFCLFTLDDLLDLMDGEDAENFLEEMTNKKLEEGKFILSELGLPIDFCYAQVLEYFSDEDQKEEFKCIWSSYIAGLQWERKNRMESREPTLDEYQKLRPHSSGVYIAIHLLKGNMLDHTCDTRELESDIARYIYLSNDLVSVAKESGIGDLHNEVILLSHDYGLDVAARIVEGELIYLCKKIKQRGQLISQISEECKISVDSLFLLVGGCLFWSGESERYTDGEVQSQSS
ncbi:terpene synthase family protein [Algoriphagus sp. C2-6-M1]|uniref:terpene synthase family protein n=1 Tax=Algoriphagus persicinus TaxID=3108754 RepID=UPI002B39CB7F|nr:terpene synthase family protein [Algoriphagus sp. C2-6-M1]MEB2782178.1 terpene synthase family protein [Algoriphagus sp. C2-6-M1]